MKLKTYFITLMAFSMNHALRIALPYNKSHVQSKYNVDDLFLGILDVLNFLMYAIGACFHFKIVNRNNIKETYLKIAIFATFSGCFFAYFSLFFEDKIFESEWMDKFIKKFILIANMCIYGFCSFSV
jgi:ABC-type Na+ efflux pump permease subunit